MSTTATGEGLSTVRFYAEERAKLDGMVRYFDGENSFWLPDKAIISSRKVKGRDHEVIVEKWAAVMAGIV
jgi:hypothetical protein